MRRFSLFLTAPTMTFALLLGACAPVVSNGSSVPPSAVQQASYVEYGVVSAGRTVRVENRGSQVAGAIAGGVVGGLVGNQFGRGRGNDIMTAAGAGVGAVVGSNAGQNAVTYATEWTVRLNNGRSVAIVQQSAFSIGQPVRVIFSPQGEARIAAR